MNLIFSIDYAKYFTTQWNGSHELELSIEKPIDVELMKLKFLTFSIVARKAANIDGIATILIEIDSKQQNSLSFEKVLYEGVLVEKDLSFVMEEIVLIAETYDQDVVLRYLGKDFDLFTFTQTDNKVKVQLSESFDVTVVKDVSDLIFEIEATKSGYESARTVVLVRISRLVIIKPQFEKSIYVGHISDIGKLVLENIVIIKETFDDSIDVSLQGDDADLFNINDQNKNVIQLGLKSATLETDKEYLQFEVAAASTIGLVKVKEIVNIFISIGRKNPATKALSFSKSIYEGTVTKEMKLVVETVMLNKDNLDDDVVIELSGRNQQFFTFTKTTSEILLRLKEGVTIDQLPNISTLLVSVDAFSDTFSNATTNVIISLLMATNSNLKFQKPLYVGSMNNLKQLMLENLFIESNNSMDFHIEISGQDRDLFFADLIDNLITVSLKEDISEDLWNSRIILIINITATFDGIKIETIVVITLPKKSQDKLLQFEKPSYIGSIDVNTVVDLEEIVLELNNFNDTLVTFVLSGMHSEFFEMKVNRNSVSLQTKEGITIEKLQNIVLVALEIKAQRDQFRTALTIVFLQLPWKVEQVDFLTFDKVSYRGKFDLNNVLHLDTLILDPTTFTEDVIVSLKDVSFVLKNGDTDIFEVKREGNDLIIVNSTQITDDKLVNKLFFSFYLEASMVQFYSTMSLIIIEIPIANSSVPIDDCIDKSDPSQPFFETGAYSFAIQTDKKGSFGRIKALIVDPKLGFIEYKLQMQNDYLSLRLSVNAESGYLVLSKELAVGLYTVTAVALNTENSKVAYSRILITVQEARICTEDVLTTVDKTLAVLVLPENVIYDQILPTVIGNCELEILYVNPSALRELFRIDRTTHFLTSMKFDREDAVFINETVPQIQLKLYLNCGTTLTANHPIAIQEQHLILTDDILFSTNSMTLNIVIEDQNDNFPVFIHPPTKNFNVGYPEQIVADSLLPPNLMIVEAFDVDEGLNAKIKYSLNDNRHFAIDPEAGIIFPLKECMLNVDEVSLIVTATDRDGALNGNAESFSLNVKKVTTDNLVVFSLKNKQLNDVELFLSNVTVATKMNLLSINYAAIPYYDDDEELIVTKQSEGNEVQTFIKMFVYAFDVDVESELKTSAEIIQLLKLANIPVTLNYSTFDDVFDCNITGLIIAVSILGALLITVCAVVPLLWFVWLRPKYETQRRSSESSVVQFDEDFNNLPSISSPVLPIKTITQKDEDVMGIHIDGVTNDESILESPTNMTRLQNALDIILDVDEVPSPTDSSGSEKKKSNVRFNELVERIEVLAEAEDAKVDDELNERL
ncbi:unnamed protein product [Diamesa serratosioi]